MSWRPRKGDPRPFCVYYLYAEDGSLLYIGRSVSPKRRRYEFAKAKGVVVSRMVVWRYATLEQSQKRELRSIAKHWPPFNAVLQSSPGPLGKKKTAAMREAISKTWSEERREAQRKLLAGPGGKFYGKPSWLKGKRGEDHPSFGRATSEEQRANYSAGAKKGWASSTRRRRNVKLAPDKVALIRSSGLSSNKLGKIVGVDPSAIRRIRRGEAWSDA